MIIALDYGSTRTGVAVSDSNELMAFRYNSIVTKKPEKLLTAVLELLYKEKADTLVIGLPLGFDDKETIMATKIREFAKNLTAKTDVKIIFWNETMSSRQAQLQKFTKDIDSESARIILQEFLDNKNNTNEK